MVQRVEVPIRRVRRALSRSERLVGLLGLERETTTRADPGLLLVQLDGLSRPQLERALAANRLPHLARLLAREHHVVQDLYSGLPSSTPAFQAELLHGVKTAVPAFSFRERVSGRVVAMFEPDAAGLVQRRLRQQGRGLLEGGSVYCGILRGGAREAHWCAAATGWHEVSRTLNPLVLAGALVAHFPAVARVAALSVAELGLALHDLATGSVDRREWKAELKMVASRVGVSILARELTAAAAELDLARGLPVVMVDFLAYDEQAHRRGPSSAFAHWTLKGIDAAIGRLHRAALRSSRRHYETWIFSDHGQEETVPLAIAQGRTLRDIAREVLQAAVLSDDPAGDLHARRARWLAPRGGERPEGPEDAADRALAEQGPAIQVADMGPLAHIYVPGGLEPAQGLAAARGMVEAGVPLVLIAGAAGEATAVTLAGDYRLPEEAAAILGPDHPFADAVAEDLLALCHHPEAGTLVLSGWRSDGPCLSFAMEHGAHGGPGSEETHAFVLTPEGALRPPTGGGPLRATHLREAALALLDGARHAERRIHALSDPASETGSDPASEPASESAPEPVPASPLRVMTYNVHGGVGTDGVRSLARIARVIARARPDIVALQELDVGRLRSLGVDQAHEIAELLRMDHHFHGVLEVDEERYGNALLSTLPIRCVSAQTLPIGPSDARLEPRGALWCRVDVGGLPVDVITTHLGLSGAQRRRHAEALVGPEWLGSAEAESRTVLLGDFNAIARGRTLRTLGTALRDAQQEAPDHRPQPTYASARPAVRIDHVFVRGALRVVGARVARGPLARIASDHLPLIVDLEVVSE